MTNDYYLGLIKKLPVFIFKTALCPLDAVMAPKSSRPEENFRRLKSAVSRRPVQVAILKAYHWWRNEEAVRRHLCDLVDTAPLGLVRHRAFRHGLYDLPQLLKRSGRHRDLFLHMLEHKSFPPVGFGNDNYRSCGKTKGGFRPILNGGRRIIKAKRIESTVKHLTHKELNAAR